jgi:hypothetical protein
VTWSLFNQAVCALKFLYAVTLRVAWPVEHIPFGRHAPLFATAARHGDQDRPLRPAPPGFPDPSVASWNPRTPPPSTPRRDQIP